MPAMKPLRPRTIAAEFTAPEDILAAAEVPEFHELGQMRAYTPFPVIGLAAALRAKRRRLAWVPIAAFLFGAAVCFSMITYATVVSYPINIGGRPLFSWPYYVIPSVASGILCAAAASFISLFIACHLPRLNHPVFEIEGFERSSTDRFFLLINAESEKFESTAIIRLLERLAAPPLKIHRVLK